MTAAKENPSPTEGRPSEGQHSPIEEAGEGTIGI